MRASPMYRGLPVELPRVLTSSRARMLGLSRAAVEHAMATRGWSRMARGVVLTAAGHPTRADWAQLGMELTGPAGALSGWDALRVYGLGASAPPSGELLVLDRSGEHRVVGGVRIRPTTRPFRADRLPAVHPTLALVPVVQVARAVTDTALLYRTVPPVRDLVTSAVQQGRCTVDELIGEYERGPRNDSWPLHQALSDALDGALSTAEAEAVDLLRQVDVPPFELNVPIVVTTGEVVAVVDVLWRELRAMAEIDSREYHYREADWKRTSRRHNRLTAGGLALQHYPPSEIRGRGLSWARDVEVWLRARAAELGTGYPSGAVLIRPGLDGPLPYLLPP